MKKRRSRANILKGKNILITGGTGFLGIALTKEILKKEPKSIRLFSRDEVKHHQAEELFNYNCKLRNFIGDVRDYSRLLKATRQVDIVIHAAALKRIDLLEYNVEEAIKTNILGTLNVVNACLANKVEKAVFVSTDKACFPVNIYGACKFVGERIFIESNYSKGDIETIFSVVRYGNVLESTGSVIPLFSAKIKGDKPIPLTDPRMTRFIISPKKAVRLIFKVLEYARGGEIFVPRLFSFKMVDLIEVLKEKYKAKNKVKITGVRPGEKIHELLINESEVSRTVEFEDFYVIKSNIEKYMNIRKPIYLREGRKVNKRSIKEYSSKDHLISKQELKNFFKKLGLI